MDFVAYLKYNVNYKDLGDFFIGVYYDKTDNCFKAGVQTKDYNSDENICECFFDAKNLLWNVYNNCSSIVREDTNLFVAVGQLLYNIL